MRRSVLAAPRGSVVEELVRSHRLPAILGYHQGGPRTVDMELRNWRALAVLNAHERRAGYQMGCMRRGLGLVASGRLDVASLVIHRFDPRHVDNAFGMLLEKMPGFRKAVVVM